MQHREAQGVVPIDLGCGERRPAASEDGVEQATVEAVRVTFLRQVPVRDDGQIGLRTHLPTGHRREPYVEVAGEEQLLFQGRTKRGASEQLQWQPEPQPAEWPRQLDRQVGRRQSVDAGTRVAEVRGAVAVRLSELAYIAHDQRSGSEGKEEALVRVEGRRLRTIYAREDVSAVRRQEEETSIRRVDVEPKPMSLRDVGDHRERIDRADVDRSGRRHHQPRVETTLAIGPYGCFECSRLHPQLLVEPDAADDALTESRDAQALLHAMVRLLSEVDDGPVNVGGPDSGSFARGENRLQRGDARTRRQIAAGGLRVADEIGHPPEQRLLKRCGRRCRETNPRVRIRSVSQQIAKRSRKEATAGNERKVASGRLVDAASPD